MPTSALLFETTTPYARYEVWDTIYGGRPARVLYSGYRQTAQSGLAQDDRPELLFDYNQRLLELAGVVRPARLLLIGGGAYTLPMALLDKLPDSRIDVVEIDGDLEAIARRFFGLRSNPRLRLIQGAGRGYIDRNTRPYDMIIVDAFMQSDTPDDLTTVEAAELYKRSLTPSGLFARNVISAYHGPDAAALHQQRQDWQNVFGHVALYPASYSLPLSFAQNLLLVASSAPLPDDLLRYPALEQE